MHECTLYSVFIRVQHAIFCTKNTNKQLSAYYIRINTVALLYSYCNVKWAHLFSANIFNIFEKKSSFEKFKSFNLLDKHLYENRLNFAFK